MKKTFTAKGFTLVELIVYVAVLMLLVGAIIPFLLNMASYRAKQFAQADLYSQMRFVTERLKYAIRNSSMPYGGTYTSGVNLVGTANYITLIRTDYFGVPDPAVTTSFGVTNNKIWENKGGPLDLTGPDVTVTELIFYNYFDQVNYSANSIGFKVTLVVNANSSKDTLKQTMTVYGSALPRNNMNF